MADFVDKTGPRKWPGVHFDWPSNVLSWRKKLATLIAVDVSLIDDWTVEEFMRDMANTRASVLEAGKDKPPPARKKPGRPRAAIHL